jgi:membrane associated rhomboid family serine protease
VRYLPFVLIAIVLIALDWAALHRITSGEHGTIAAWIVVAVSGLILGVMLGILMRPRQKKREG